MGFHIEKTKNYIISYKLISSVNKKALYQTYIPEMHLNDQQQKQSYKVCVSSVHSESGAQPKLETPLMRFADNCDLLQCYSIEKVTPLSE